MNRRYFLAGVAATTTAHVFAQRGPVDVCATPLPIALLRHDLIAAAWQGIDPTQVWDAHTHIVGIGNSDSGTYVHPDTGSWLSPIERARRIFIMRAACVSAVPDDGVDAAYVQRLLSYADAMPAGYRMLLFAFDYTVDEAGRERPEATTFAVPNEYVARIARAHPQRFGWVSSVHPYRPDALELLSRVVNAGALAIKWLPSSMNIDPASPRCDAFYGTLAKWRLPLIVHSGEEKAVPGARQQHLNNPLRLRRALDAGVRVVVAHCASLGHATDIDRGAEGPQVPAFQLFGRLMDDPRYSTHLFGDVSAVFQRNRTLEMQRTLLARTHWHARLLHGSDYPLPGLGFLYNLDAFVEAKLLPPEAVSVLETIRQHNPLLFEFVLKRTVALDGARLATSVFHTREFFNHISA